jgi:hypothetical protein
MAMVNSCQTMTMITQTMTKTHGTSIALSHWHVRLSDTIDGSIRSNAHTSTLYVEAVADETRAY